MSAMARSAFHWRDLRPSRDFAIVTTWPPEVVATELAKNISSDAIASVPFVGSCDGQRFQFARRTSFDNAYLPVITAEVWPHPRGAQVDVMMRMRPFSVAFLGLWMAFSTAFALMALRLLLRGTPQGFLFLVFPFFGGARSFGAFAYEAHKSEALLRALFPPAHVPHELPPYR
jgi:hypothetical protein